MQTKPRFPRSLGKIDLKLPALAHCYVPRFAHRAAFYKYCKRKLT